MTPYLFSWTFSFAQYDTVKYRIPMQNGILVYGESFQLPKSKATSGNFRNIQKWISAKGPEYRLAISNKDEKSQTITGSVLFRVDIPQTGNYFWLKARILILMHSDSLKIQVRDFYEKPIEKGVTNDYSKIEYRWRDFRNGKPWSSEDEALFRGLDQNARRLLDSILQWMNR